MKRAFTIIVPIFIFSFSFGQNLDCSKAFELALKTELKIKDKGSFDRSFISRIETEEFREYLNSEYQKRIRGGGTKGGGFKLFGIKLIDLPEIDLDNNKEIDKTEHSKFVSKWKKSINQKNKQDWLKEFATSYLPSSLSEKILYSWDDCNDGIISINKHKENIKVILAQIDKDKNQNNNDTQIKLQKDNNQTTIRLLENENSTVIKLKEELRQRNLDYYDYLIKYKKLVEEGLADQRSYELEKYRIDAKKRGLIYDIKVRDNTTIDIELDYIKPFAKSPNEVEITKIYLPGLKFNDSQLYEGLTFSSKKTIVISVPSNIEKVDILIETDIEVPIRYYKNLSSNTYKGSKSYTNGKYVGDLVSDTPQGNGTYTTKNYIYEGVWENKKMIFAKKKKKTGELIYEGSFKNLKPHGNGTYYYYRNGFTRIYKGLFENGYIKSGTCIYEEDFSYKKYIGEFKNFKRHGKGKLIWRDDTYFEGEFENGNRKKGTITYDNGDFYKGSFLNNKRHGFGYYYRTWKVFGIEKKSLLYKGTYYNGKRYNGKQFSLGGTLIYKWINGIQEKVNEE